MSEGSGMLTEHEAGVAERLCALRESLEAYERVAEHYRADLPANAGPGSHGTLFLADYLQAEVQWEAARAALHALDGYSEEEDVKDLRRALTDRLAELDYDGIDLHPLFRDYVVRESAAARAEVVRTFRKYGF